MGEALERYKGGAPVPWLGGGAMERRRLVKQAQLEIYRHDLATEVADHEAENVDYFADNSIRRAVHLADRAAWAVAVQPESIGMIERALMRREAALDRIAAKLQ